MSISVEYLAELGCKRMIPTLFERAWKNDGRDNPVATAIRIVKNKRKHNNRRCLFFAMLALLAAFVITLGDSRDANDIDGTFRYVVQSVFLVIAGIGILLALEGKGQQEVNDTAVITFCEQLALVSHWCGHDFDGLSPELQHRGDDDIKAVGTHILVKAATAVLQMQEGEKAAESPEAKERLEVRIGNEMTEFTRRYNTLSRLGLASGGYKKYFEQARRIVDSAASSR